MAAWRCGIVSVPAARSPPWHIPNTKGSTPPAVMWRRVVVIIEALRYGCLLFAGATQKDPPQSQRLSPKVSHLSTRALRFVLALCRLIGLSSLHPAPMGGAFRERHERGAGCDGRLQCFEFVTLWRLGFALHDRQELTSACGQSDPSAPRAQVRAHAT